jgi:short-subunit dehydrogenase
MHRNTIFITGAAAGIGKETALLFARKGWYIGLFDIDGEALKSLEREIGAAQCCAHRIDVSDIGSVKEAFAFFSRATGGHLNVLFNNAGIIHAGTLEEIGLEKQKRLFEINIWGVMNCTIQALPYLKKSKPARIVNMSSASALYGHPALTAYAASKMAVRSMTEGFDLGLSREGIQACDLMPLWVQTNLARTAANDWAGLKMEEVKISPQHVAETVWKAVHATRLHWLIGGETHLYQFLTNVLPNRLIRRVARFILKS